MSNENKNPGKELSKFIIICILKIIIVIMLLFTIANITILPASLIICSRHSECQKEKVYLVSADLINKIDIIPLSKVCGYKHEITVPFYFIRDKFYNSGISLLGGNSAEKMYWWYNIRFYEFKMIVEPFIKEQYTKYEAPISELPKDIIEPWLNELYENIQNFAEIDTYESKYNNDMLIMLRLMISSYTRDSRLLSVAERIRSNPIYIQARKEGKTDPGPDYNAIKHNLELINLFDNYKNKIKNQNLEAYNKYAQKPIIDEYYFRSAIIARFLWYQEEEGQIDCNSKEIKEFFELKSKIIHYAIDNPNLSIKEELKCQNYLFPDIDYSLCPELREQYKNERQKFSEFIEKRIQQSSLEKQSAKRSK